MPLTMNRFCPGLTSAWVDYAIEVSIKKEERFLLKDWGSWRVWHRLGGEEGAKSKCHNATKLFPAMGCDRLSKNYLILKKHQLPGLSFQSVGLHSSNSEPSGSKFWLTNSWMSALVGCEPVLKKYSDYTIKSCGFIFRALKSDDSRWTFANMYWQQARPVAAKCNYVNIRLALQPSWTDDIIR